MRIPSMEVMLMTDACERALPAAVRSGRHALVSANGALKCRVAPGGYPPEAPTDPDVRDSRIRLLGERIRYVR